MRTGLESVSKLTVSAGAISRNKAISAGGCGPRHQYHQSASSCHQHSPGVGPPSPASKNLIRSRWNAGSFGARPTNKRAQRFRVKRAGCESYRV